MKKLKDVTKKQAEIICFKVDMEGLDYGIGEYGDELAGTKLYPLVEQYRELRDKLESELNALREKFDIEES